MSASVATKGTSQKLLQRAQQLLQSKGFNALSFQELADAIGIRKASVHHYFATKQDLAVAVLKDYQTRFEKWSVDIVDLGPLGRLDAYFDMLWAVTEKGKMVCPGGALCMDWKGLSSSSQRELENLLSLHRDFLKRMLDDGRQSGAFPNASGDSEALVALIGSAMQGGLQLGRISADPSKYFARLQSEIKRVLGVKV
jgi:TetR/AcrR family transcriptional repressor of nem operon